MSPGSVDHRIPDWSSEWLLQCYIMVIIGCNESIALVKTFHNAFLLLRSFKLRSFQEEL